MLRKYIAPNLLHLTFCCSLLTGAPMAALAQASDVYAPGKQIVADFDHIVTPNGVQEAFTAQLGGVGQVVNVRGADRNNPILIYLHGGPGAVEMPFAWAFQRWFENSAHMMMVEEPGRTLQALVEIVLQLAGDRSANP